MAARDIQEKATIPPRIRNANSLMRMFTLASLTTILSLHAQAAGIDLTRHISHHSPAYGESVTVEASFFGVVGDARLIVMNSSDASLAIQLNGKDVVDANTVATAHLEIPVALDEMNSIAVTLGQAETGSVSIRVKQLAEIELNVLSRVHFNTNVSNFAEARSFYGKLGFETISGFPDTNTLEMARAIGIETPTSYDGTEGEAAGGYLLHGELVGPGGFSGGLIDLIEFTIPRNEAPPYAGLNHLGMARAVMLTTNIAADFAYMQAQGIEFIAAPTSRSDGTIFAIFQDLDGTHYELREMVADGEVEQSQTTYIARLGAVNVNASDFERSRAWYQMLGFEVTNKLATTDSIEVANAMGFSEKYQIDGAVITHSADGSSLELVQWLAPFDPERAYDIPVNHLGMHRMAFSTSDIAADVAALKAQGVEFVSVVTPCCSGPDSWGSIVAFYDPDGTIVELVEQPGMSQLLSLLNWFRKTLNVGW